MLYLPYLEYCGIHKVMCYNSLVASQQVVSILHLFRENILQGKDITAQELRPLIPAHAHEWRVRLIPTPLPYII